MPVQTKSLMAQTADDLMSRALVFLREDMTLRDAAQLMLRNQIGGAPVVNAQGGCVGVFSAIDFLSLDQKRTDLLARLCPHCQSQQDFNERPHRSRRGNISSRMTGSPSHDEEVGNVHPRNVGERLL
jgi:CBS-domain-containing membrane protein